MSDEFLSLFRSINGNISKSDIIKIIMDNIEDMTSHGYLKHAASRSNMPQLDALNNLKDNPELWKKPLENGVINFIPQYTKKDTLLTRN